MVYTYKYILIVLKYHSIHYRIRDLCSIIPASKAVHLNNNKLYF